MDRARIESLYRTHGAVVLRRARQILGGEDDAREILQEVFVALVNDPDQFRGDASPLTWLYAATTNRCLNRLRDARTRRELLRARGDVAPFSEAPVAEHGLALRDLLLNLPEETARAAVYFYFDEMTYDEIAVAMGRSRRHVGNLLEGVRARTARLREVAP